MNTIDNHKAILALYERLNRLIVPMYHLAYNERQPEIAAIRRQIKRLEKQQTDKYKYVPTNYADVIYMSQIGRERIAVYPYPKNPFDNISRHNKVVRFAKFHKAHKILKMRQISSMVKRMA